MKLIIEFSDRMTIGALAYQVKAIRASGAFTPTKIEPNGDLTMMWAGVWSSPMFEDTASKAKKPEAIVVPAPQPRGAGRVKNTASEAKKPEAIVATSPPSHVMFTRRGEEEAK